MNIEVNNTKKQKNIFKVFPWQVIDKTHQSNHPLWFKTYEDLKSFYRAHPLMWKNHEDLRILKMDESGKEAERYEFEV